MKKTLTIIFIILSFILILDSMNFGHALTMFLLAGIIPGTNVSLSAGWMLELFAITLGFVVARICVYFVKLLAVGRNTLSPEL